MSGVRGVLQTQDSTSAGLFNVKTTCLGDREIVSIGGGLRRIASTVASPNLHVGLLLHPLPLSTNITLPYCVSFSPLALQASCEPPQPLTFIYYWTAPVLNAIRNHGHYSLNDYPLNALPTHSQSVQMKCELLCYKKSYSRKKQKVLSK